MTPKKPIKAILASNGELWWEGLSLLFKKSGDVDVVAMCYDLETTVKKASDLKPDLLLFDEELISEDVENIEEQINELDPAIKIIVALKPYKSSKPTNIFKSRVKAYIDKDITYEELMTSIRHVSKGGVIVLSHVVAQEILEYAALNMGNYDERARPRLENDAGLSKREEEILQVLVNTGGTNRQIAEKLCISESTVKAHMSSIFEKMKVRNRHNAISLVQGKYYLFSK